MKKLSINLVAVLAILFATGSAFASSKVLAQVFYINANKSTSLEDGPDGENESEVAQPSVPSNLATWQSQNCTAGLPECAAVYDATTGVYTIISGTYRF